MPKVITPFLGFQTLAPVVGKTTDGKKKEEMRCNRCGQQLHRFSSSYRTHINEQGGEIEYYCVENTRLGGKNCLQAAGIPFSETMYGE